MSLRTARSGRGRRALRRAADGLREWLLPERGLPRRSAVALVAAVGVLLGCLLALSDLVQRLDWSLYDRYVRMAARGAQAPPDVVIVAQDDPSDQAFGLPLPWPRRLYAELIAELARRGARTIALDLLFYEPGPSAEDDALLVEAVREAGNVVLAADLEQLDDHAYSLVQWRPPFPELEEVVADVGVARLPFDPDGVVRRAPLEIGGYPTLASAAAGLRGEVRLPDDPQQARLIHFNGPPRRGVTTYSFYQVLDPDSLLPPEAFRDKVVLVGLSLTAGTADATPDHFRTPTSVRMPGVEIHANLVDTLLRDRFIGDPLGSRLGVVALCLFGGTLALFSVQRLGPTRGFLAILAVALAVAAGGHLVLAHTETRLPVLGPLLAGATTYVTLASYRYALTRRERKLIKRAFQYYVDPAIVDRMLADPSRLRLGGEEYEVSVVFTDLAGFTSIAEQLSPADLAHHLSEYFKEMTDLLLAEGGTLDKFIGDAIMVFFGCPLRDPDHAAQACRAAVAMQRRMVELNAAWSERGLPELHTRIGINTGPVVAGNMGTDTIFNFTILGDCVNLASRLEGVNKVYGTLTIVGATTRAEIGEEFELRELDWIRVKGKTEPEGIYELMGTRGTLSERQAALRKEFDDGLALYRAGRFDEAHEAFRRALELYPADGPSATFLARCRDYAAAPPPPGWDGVHVMTTK